MVFHGVYGVFVHSSISGSERYAEEDAEHVFSVESAAERFRQKSDPDGVRLVTRFVSR